MNPVIIALTNQKGGVGKTSLTIHLAGAMIHKNKKVLVVDLDAQGHLSKFFLGNIYALNKTIRDIIVFEEPAENVIAHTRYKKIDIIPANISFADVDAQLAGADDAQYILKDSLEILSRQYDYILMDCPPFLGRATRMALTFATHVIVPVQAQEWAAEGAGQLNALIQQTKKRNNPNLEFMGVIINMLMGKRKIETDVKKFLRNSYGDKVFKTEIKNVAIYPESITRRKMVVGNNSTSKEAKVFIDLFEEIESRVQGFQ